MKDIEKIMLEKVREGREESPGCSGQNLCRCKLIEKPLSYITRGLKSAVDMETKRNLPEQSEESFDYRNRNDFQLLSQNLMQEL